MAMKRTLEDMLTEAPSRAELLLMDGAERLAFHDANEKNVLEKGKQRENRKVVDKIVAKQIYDTAKSKFAEEKERHRIIEEGFAEEKAKHREERERFSAATAQFQKDAYAWKCICREERMAKTARTIEEDNVFDEDLERLKEKFKGKGSTNAALAELEVKLKEKE